MADSATIDLSKLRTAMRFRGLCPPAMPFLGVLETFEASAANVVFAQPCGPKREPGAAWEFVRLQDAGVHFAPFRAPAHCPIARIAKLEEFGVRVGWIPAERAIFFETAETLRCGFARTIAGERWLWRPNGAPALDTITIAEILWPHVLEAVHRANRRFAFTQTAVRRGFA